jgi:hypothetical protein
MRIVCVLELRRPIRCVRLGPADRGRPAGGKARPARGRSSYRIRCRQGPQALRHRASCTDSSCLAAPVPPCRTEAQREPGAHGDLHERIQAEQLHAAFEQGVQAWLSQFQHFRGLDLAQIQVSHAGRDSERELALERG